MISRIIYYLLKKVSYKQIFQDINIIWYYVLCPSYANFIHTIHSNSNIKLIPSK